MDYVLRLPAELSRRFDSELETMEKDLNMPYVTSIERNALREGSNKVDRGRGSTGRDSAVCEGLTASDA